MIMVTALAMPPKTSSLWVTVLGLKMIVGFEVGVAVGGI
jgi:hypothetical protein